MHKKIIFLSFLLLLFQHASASPINVVLVSPSSQGDIFWSQVTEITKASAEDLNVNLKVHHNIGNRVLLDELLSKIIASPTKPDYIIFLPFGGNIERTFSTLEQAKISFVTIERTYEQHLHIKSIGKPLGKFKHWVGEVFFDNFKAGELLAQSLYRHASKLLTKNSETYQTVGLSGSFHPGSTRRSDGLLKFSKLAPIDVKQVVYTNWQKEIAKDKLRKLISRYDKPDIIWCASDLNAIGSLEVIKDLNLKPNQDVVIGGFDWTPLALKKIQQNQLTASVGGHLFQGAMALIKVFD